MKLSRTVSYAVRAAIQLAQAEPGVPIPCSQIANAGHMPERFLLQILRNLVTHGILSSTRGVDGGYKLEKTPESISLLDVIEAVEGPMTSNLPTQTGFDEESAEKLQGALDEVSLVARRELSAVKLASLLPSKPPKLPDGTPTGYSILYVDPPQGGTP